MRSDVREGPRDVERRLPQRDRERRGFDDIRMETFDIELRRFAHDSGVQLI